MGRVWRAGRERALRELVREYNRTVEFDPRVLYDLDPERLPGVSPGPRLSPGSPLAARSAALSRRS